MSLLKDDECRNCFHVHPDDPVCVDIAHDPGPDGGDIASVCGCREYVDLEAERRIVVAPVLDADERKAIDAILAAGDAILALGLTANKHEFFMHIHGLQGFVVQHMLHRLQPDHWNAWFEEDER